MDLKIRRGRIGFPSLKREVSLLNPKIKKAKIPGFVTIPVSQHAGTPAVPVVKEGDRVRAGTLIGAPDGEFSAAVHSSVSGVVRSVGMFPHPYLGEGLAVQIESDGKDAQEPDIKEQATDKLTPREILEKIRAAGVVGLSGSAFPTHLRLAPKKSKIDALIINGVECEPYLVSDYLTMMECANEIVQGAKLLQRALGGPKMYLAVGEDKLEALETVNSKLFSLHDSFIEPVSLPPLYPNGEERVLIREVLGREVPFDREPADLGILVMNVSTLVAVHEAVKKGKPLYERVVTVTGECLAQPRNLLVRIGTSVQDVIKECQGLLRKPGRLVMGGPMRGVALDDQKVPVVKATTGIIALAPEDTARGAAEPCVRCGDCIEACPMYLNPSMLTLSVEAGRWDLVRQMGAEICTECGNCTYVCPSNRPMAELMRKAIESV